MVFPEPEVTCANTNCVELEVIKMPNAVSDVTAQVAVTRAFPYTAQREFPSVAMVQVGSENFPMLRLKNPQQNTSPVG